MKTDAPHTAHTDTPRVHAQAQQRQTSKSASSAPDLFAEMLSGLNANSPDVTPQPQVQPEPEAGLPTSSTPPLETSDEGVTAAAEPSAGPTRASTDRTPAAADAIDSNPLAALLAWMQAAPAAAPLDPSAPKAAPATNQTVSAGSITTNTDKAVELASPDTLTHLPHSTAPATGPSLPASSPADTPMAQATKPNGKTSTGNRNAKDLSAQVNLSSQTLLTSGWQSLSTDQTMGMAGVKPPQTSAESHLAGALATPLLSDTRSRLSADLGDSNQPGGNGSGQNPLTHLSPSSGHASTSLEPGPVAESFASSLADTLTHTYESLGTQVSVWSAANTKHAQMTVDLGHAGALEVAVNLEDGKAQLSFLSDDVQVREHLRSQGNHTLTELLAQAGITLDSLSVGQQNAGGHPADHWKQAEGHRPPARGPSPTAPGQAATIAPTSVTWRPGSSQLSVYA